MADLLAGALTFLFTDIEGSTRLWEETPEAMRVALARHDNLLRATIEAANGNVIKTTGDGVHAVFTRTAEGAAAALACQRAIQDQAWPGLPRPLRIRAGLHTGEAEARDGDYYGPALNRAARLMSAASGGQTLLSAVTAELAQDGLPAGAALRDLGEHRLKDLARPERVYQLSAPELPADFPPLKTLDLLPNNLPIQLTSFVGREQEIAEVKALLGGTRLLTLTGSGGTGKTRLSLQAAADLLDQYYDGVWLVELAPLADPAHVPLAVAAVLGLREPQGRTAIEALTDYLRHKVLLLVLDNCEHMVTACAELAQHLLTACPKLTVLASSREALGLAGETSFRVPSLALPAAGQTAPAALQRCDSARLFIERARAHRPGFVLTEANASAAVQICQRLDGIPLALELAAARVTVLTIEQIAARLDDRFRLLTGGSRTALPRQQTLRALIDWSWEPLPDAERTVLRRLSVLAGGWTLEAAEAVVGEADTLDLLGQLVNKSLVVAELDQSIQARYRLLETIRHYAREKLLDAGEVAAVRDRHLAFFLDMAEAAWSKIMGMDMVAAFDSLEEDQDNLRAALEWALDRNPLAALRMAAVLHLFWGRRGSATEGLKWVRAALTRGEAAFQGVDSENYDYLAAKAGVLAGEAELLFQLGDTLAAREVIEACIALARRVNATSTLAAALGVGSTICGLMGEVDTARAWAQETAALGRQYGYDYVVSLVSSSRLFLSMVSGIPVSESEVEGIVQTGRATGNPWVIAMVASNVGRLAVWRGDADEAERRLSEAANLYHQMKDRPMYTNARADLGHALRRAGRYAEALSIYRATLRAWQEMGYRAAMTHEVECFGLIALAFGQLDRASKLFGWAEGYREAIKSPMSPFERPEYEAALDTLKISLDPAELSQFWAAGRAMDADAAVDMALEVPPAA